MSTCLKEKKELRHGEVGKQTRIQNCISNLNVRDNELTSSLFLSLFLPFSPPKIPEFHITEKQLEN